MEREIRNNEFDNREGSSFNENRVESFAASEMADRGPKDVLADRSGFDTDAAAIRPVNNPKGEEGDEDYDDEEDDLADDDGIEIDEVDADEVAVDDVELTEDELDDDLDLDLDDDADEEDETA